MYVSSWINRLPTRLCQTNQNFFVWTSIANLTPPEAQTFLPKAGGLELYGSFQHTPFCGPLIPFFQQLFSIPQPYWITPELPFPPTAGMAEVDRGELDQPIPLKLPCSPLATCKMKLLLILQWMWLLLQAESKEANARPNTDKNYS